MDDNTENDILKRITMTLEAGMPKVTQAESDIPTFMWNLSKS